MRVLVVEPTPEGHYLGSYARRVIEEVQRRGWSPMLLTSRQALEHPAYDIVRRAAGGELPTHTMEHISHPGGAASAIDLLRFQARRFSAIRRALSSLPSPRPDVAYLVNIDHIDKIMLLRGSPFGALPWAGMLLSVRHHHGRQGVHGSGTRNDRLYEMLFHRLLRTRGLGAINTVDLLIDTDLQQQPAWVRERVVPAPDIAFLEPLPARADARRQVGVAATAQVVLVYGAISRRKGVAELISATAQEDAAVVLLAGRQQPDVLDVLRSAAAQRMRSEGRLLEWDRFLTSAEEAVVFAAADAVWLGYRGFAGMSGVLLQAAFAGAPVVACREGLIGWLTAKSGVGVVVDVTDDRAVRGALDRVAQDATRDRIAQCGRLLAAQHTPEAFGRATGKALERAIARPQ